MPNINIIEATDPKDRPAEVVAQLRDIAEWLGSEGNHDLSDIADQLADDVCAAYPEAFNIHVKGA